METPLVVSLSVPTLLLGLFTVVLCLIVVGTVALLVRLACRRLLEAIDR